MGRFFRGRGMMAGRILLMVVASASLAGCVVAPYGPYPRWHPYYWR